MEKNDKSLMMEDDARECPHFSWNGQCFQKNIFAVCPHCFQNRIKCKDNPNRHKSVAAVVALCLFICSNLFAANNLQVWTQENIAYGIAKNLSTTLSQENRIGLDRTDNKKHIDEIHIAPSLDYRVYDRLAIGVNYRHVLLRKGSDTRYTNDRRPGVDVAIRERLICFELLNRSRFICHIPEGENPYFRYRNMTKVSLPVGIMAPYCSYEWYYDEGSKHREYRKNDRFSQQWLTVGIDWKIRKSIKLTGYYMLTENKDRKDHNWQNGHVLGIGMSFAF